MMTFEEKMEMYKGKKSFITEVNKAFEGKSIGSVISVDYEVYHKEVIYEGVTRDHFAEFLIVNFVGGGKSVKVVSGNSNTANFRVLGTMLDGGQYEDKPYYMSLLETGYELVEFSADEITLEELLKKPMNYISDVRNCLEHCVTGKDVVRVIKMIPSCFGSFEVEFNENGESFTIINYYGENGVTECDEEEYDFLEG